MFISVLTTAIVTLAVLISQNTLGRRSEKRITPQRLQEVEPDREIALTALGGLISALWLNRL